MTTIGAGRRGRGAGGGMGEGAGGEGGGAEGGGRLILQGGLVEGVKPFLPALGAEEEG
jgi:hypothetical protein